MREVDNISYHSGGKCVKQNMYLLRLMVINMGCFDPVIVFRVSENEIQIKVREKIFLKKASHTFNNNSLRRIEK